MDHRPFDAGAALTFLDDVAVRFGPSGIISTEAAWDAAWIACVTLDRRHEAVARVALAGVYDEVDRLCIASTPTRAAAPTAQASS